MDQASEHNNENMMVTNEPTFVGAFQAQFEKLWAEFSMKAPAVASRVQRREAVGGAAGGAMGRVAGPGVGEMEMDTS
jgi:hypothetical protein